MNVAAVVVNYNAGDQLRRCVESLLADGVDQVVVVDNGSVDGSGERLAASVPSVRYIATGTNLGYGGGANRGAAAASDADALLVLNPDTEVMPGTIKALVDALDADPRLGIVGPRLENLDGSLYPSARTFPDLVDALGHAFLGSISPHNRFTRRYRMLDWDHERGGEVDWVSGACFLARRAAWDDIRGFDERYFMFMEDVYLCWRARRAGWRVAYVPQGRVVHVVGLSRARHPFRMELAHHRSMLRYARDTTVGWRRALLPVMAVGMAVRLAVQWCRLAMQRVRPRSAAD